MTKIIVSLFIIYGSVLLLLFLFQRSAIYYPHKLDQQFRFPPYVPGLEEVFITCDDGCVINGLFVPGRSDKPTVLIFHGNAGNVTHRDFLLREFSRPPAEEVPAPEEAPELTARETTILQLVVDGLTNKEIAASLIYSEKTLKNRLSALRFAYGEDIVPGPSDYMSRVAGVTSGSWPQVPPE